MLRLAVPLKDIDDVVSAVAAADLGGVFIGGGIGVRDCLAFFAFPDPPNRPPARIRGGLGAEPPLETVLREGNDELGALGRSLHRTSDQVRGLVERLSQNRNGAKRFFPAWWKAFWP